VRRLASDRFVRRHREQGKSAFIVEADAADRHPQVDSLEVKEDLPRAGVGGASVDFRHVHPEAAFAVGLFARVADGKQFVHHGRIFGVPS
jgi:hypothetical protein